MGKKLYVGNLAPDVTDKDLEGLFAQAGMCESVAVVSDKGSGQSRGFGFVEMGSVPEAQMAIEKLNGTDLKGRALNVSEARDQARSTNGGDRPRR
jgi:RNA recognition motif-containing protein